MNERRQRRVLYREFLFRIADRELLSAYSSGDASRLLLQIVTLLLCTGALFSIPAFFIAPVSQPQAQLLISWSVEHFLIATTMLTVGVFVVLGWGAFYPDQRDVLVLSPLPVRARTIMAARMAAVGTALAGIVLALHAVSSLAWPVRLNAAAAPYTIPGLISDSARSPVDAAGLQAVLDDDLATATRTGALAPGSGQGVVIGVSTRGTRRVLAYGAASPDSVFPIASVTKVFTGLALARLIEQGLVGGTEPIRALVPEASLSPPARGRPDITPLDLVTHRSGLPGMPRDVRPRDPANPFADFDVATLYAFLARRGVARPFGAGFEYSNVGFGLLGHALATRAGVDYPTLINRLITAPLAMHDTAVALTAGQQRRLLPGHDREHRAVRSWEVGDGLLGAGALNSTAPDLLTLLEANLHPDRLPSGVLSRAIKRSQQRQDMAGDAGIGFAWLLSRTGELAHSGDIAGYSAQVWFKPATDSALVVLANTERGTSASADVIAEHVRARLDGRPPIALTDLTIPTQRGVRGWLRMFVAYWLTMLAAALLVFCAAAGLQGLAAALLPHRIFQRVSPILQLGVLCAVVGGYFLQPMVVTPTALLDAQRGSWPAPSPTLWLLGLFQALSGSPALAPLARQALGALGATLVLAAAATWLSYVRTLRRMAEAPDLVPAVQMARHLPPAGDALSTAVAHFTARTLFRSPSHRVLFTFYLGVGVAVTAVLLKTPRALAAAEDPFLGAMSDTSVPLIVSSIVMMVCAVVGARLTFAMPRDLPANWILRVLPLPGGARYVAARRRTFVVLAAGPVWVACAAVFLAQWPWRAALEHLTLLALLGAILVEACLRGTQRIPFTCSYLPGRLHAHVTVPLGVVLLLVLALTGADLEREVLGNPAAFASLAGLLSAVWIGARWWTSQAQAAAQPEFEDAPADRLIAVELWDVRR